LKSQKNNLFLEQPICKFIFKKEGIKVSYDDYRTKYVLENLPTLAIHAIL